MPAGRIRIRAVTQDALVDVPDVQGRLRARHRRMRHEPRDDEGREGDDEAKGCCTTVHRRCVVWPEWPGERKHSAFAALRMGFGAADVEPRPHRADGPADERSGSDIAREMDAEGDPGERDPEREGEDPRDERIATRIGAEEPGVGAR